MKLYIVYHKKELLKKFNLHFLFLIFDSTSVSLSEDSEIVETSKQLKKLIHNQYANLLKLKFNSIKISILLRLF